jgi:hypothetical protein
LPDRTMTTAMFLACPVRDLEALVTPKRLDLLAVVDLPVAAKLAVRAAPAAPRVVHRELAQPRPQQLPRVIRYGFRVTLRGSVLAHDRASLSFGDPEPLAQHDHCCTAPVRG